MPATWIPGVGRLENGEIVNTLQEQANADAERAAEPPNQQAIRDRIDQAVTILEQAWANWDTLTPAQKDAALKLSVRITAGLARLQLRKLDETG